MRKQNNRPEISDRKRSSTQQRVKSSSVSGKTEDGLTNLLTIDVPKINLEPIRESRKPSYINSNDNKSVRSLKKRVK